MPPVKHALLGASGAARWINCPPSARLCESLPDTESPYAAEGTLAHAIGELKLRKLFLEKMGPKKYKAALTALQGRELYDPEMESCTDLYRDYVHELALRYPSRPYITVEASVDFSHWVPEGFGTCDCLLIGRLPDGRTALHIVDYKHGKGVPVAAEDNPQMLCYALGALHKYSALYTIDLVCMSIVQPRLAAAPSEWELRATELLAWADGTLAPAAKLSWEGKGEFCPGEKQCRFCKAKARCRARAERYSTAAEDFAEKPLPPLLTPADAGGILTRLQGFETWLKEVQEFALSAALAGEPVPGWKAVEGRSVRVWADQSAAFAAVQAAGTDEAMLYERRPISLSETEKLLGKAGFARLCGPYVVKPAGKPALVPETDKRPAYCSAADDFNTKEKE